MPRLFRPLVPTFAALLLALPVAAQEAAAPEPAPAPGDEAAPSDAEAQEAAAFAAIGFKPGPFTGELGSQASVEVKEGWLFVGADGARKFLELTQNIPSGDELGVILAEDWFVLFSFDAIGYVKDDDKDDLDADEMLESIKEGVAQANEIHRKRGGSTLEVIGWAQPPHYDEQSHNLEWAPKAKSSEGHEVVNYNTRLLGRSGVMKVALIASPEVALKVMPEFRTLLGGFSFKAGSDYASFVQGDRVAEYGLAALVAGGGLAVAAKSGLLQKFWKLIVLTFAGLYAGIKKFFGGDRVSDSQPPPSDPPPPIA